MRGQCDGAVYFIPRAVFHITQFLDNARALWLERLVDYLPEKILDKSWCPTTPPHMAAASQLLHRLYRSNQAFKYRRALTPARKAQLSQKLAASQVCAFDISRADGELQIFRDKKQSYPNSVAEPFIAERLQPPVSTNPHTASLSRILMAAGVSSFLFLALFALCSCIEYMSIRAL
jgi:hypothetical protein